MEKNHKPFRSKLRNIAPREGTETNPTTEHRLVLLIVKKYSSPRGDGNEKRYTSPVGYSILRNIAPREGTETDIA